MQFFDVLCAKLDLYHLRVLCVEFGSAKQRLYQRLSRLSFHPARSIVSGVAINTPVMCQVRKRLTRHGGETIDAPDEWA
ncbi:MAG: hypothetical protein L0229_05125, partial [Blastocatellia bacterium]|nr:hypothetical protein [Blastocatellia bacterium]